MTLTTTEFEDVPSASDASPAEEPSENNIPTHDQNSDHVQDAQQSQASSEACGTDDAVTAITSNIRKVPPDPYPWNPYSAVSFYDPCSALSWAVIPIEGGTVSSPYQIMLFHKGEFLGTATARAYGFAPVTDRVDDSTLSVTYWYAMPGDYNVNPTGRANATFTWSDEQQKVIMDGDVPPT